MKLKKQIIFGILIAILFLMFGLIFSRVKGELEIKCNSGKIGINYSGEWNQTKFFNKFLELNNIENLNCEIKGSYDGPWWIFLLR